MQDETKHRDRHLVRLTDEQLDHLLDLVGRASDEVLGALTHPEDGMVLTFGDSCDFDTFYTVFQPLVDRKVTVNGVLILVTSLQDGDEAGLYGILLDEDAEPVRPTNRRYVYRGFDWSELRTVVIH